MNYTITCLNTKLYIHYGILNYTSKINLKGVLADLDGLTMSVLAKELNERLQTGQIQKTVSNR